jgi:hypothetical protein
MFLSLFYPKAKVFKYVEPPLLSPAEVASAERERTPKVVTGIGVVLAIVRVVPDIT